MVDFQKLHRNKYIKDIYEIAKKLKKEIFLVGGAVRDLILGKEEIRDFDFVLLSDPKDFVEELSKKWKKSYKSYPFKTYEFEFDNFEFDFAMARKESYLKEGSLPQIEKAESIEEDLKRRDFTINAVALLIYPEMKIIDVYNGINDIKNKKIKILKNESFREDPTRAIRAIKYKVKLNFDLEITEKEFEMAKKFIKNVSFPRIKKEIREISILKERKKIIEELLKFNLLKSYFEENLEEENKILKFLELFDKNLKNFSKKDWIYILAIILKNENYIKKIDLFLEKNEKRELLNSFKNQKKEKCYEMKDKSLFISLLKSDFPYYKIKSIIKNFCNLRIFVNGDFLIKMGFKGEKIGKILKEIKINKIEGKIKDKFEEIKFIENYFKI
ncbi:MAG: hypothetical protein ABIM78_04985 [candidate division WOR-3 bacterium]